MRQDSPRRGGICELEVADLVNGGDALGRLADGTIVFVPYALPGERLRARILEAKAGYVRAKPLEVLRPSPERQSPRCGHFGECGGCHYQHVAYLRQLELKRQILREQLVRIGGLLDPSVEPALPSPSAWEYRNHVQFRLTDRGRLGFRAPRSHRVVPLEECHLPEPPLNVLWPELSRLFSPTGRPGGLQRLILRAGSGGPPLILIETAPGAREPASTLGNRADLPPVLRDCSWWWHRTLPTKKAAGKQAGEATLRRLWGDEALEMSVLGERFRLSPLSFFQVNSPGAETLVRQVLENCGEERWEHALDLYCGVGLFSRFLASRAAALTAVELSPWACRDFRINLGLTSDHRRDPGGLSGLRLIEADVLSALRTIREPPELVVADPPRAGLGAPVVQQLSRWCPRRLVYVSCDSATLARDAGLLVRAGWTLASVRPVDLFPQTAHLESVSLWHGPRPRAKIRS